MGEFVREVGGREFVVFCSDGLAAQAAVLLDVIGRMSAEGRVFRAGDVFNFGGMLFLIGERGGRMTVGLPVVDGQAVLGDGDDISFLLALLVAQLGCARALGVEPEQANLWDKVVVAEGCLSAEWVYLERSVDVEAGDSGWFVGSLADGGDFALRSLRVWQLLRIRPALARVLALPGRFVVVFKGSQVVSVFDSEGVELMK
ncbi:immunity protein Imm33 domain-containing protein [Corallococcus silvisoli]|uniref:immunity protein Imm33 domain-containing protein n=1 Tax=Corallococcus silvisoli TaxID=2697031 RepID=UPI001376ADA3|nr:hypothetical protein [Corallococcus silvisoli]NBD08512.1 hypothetical protein [Corallococcus silvisoli]